MTTKRILSLLSGVCVFLLHARQASSWGLLSVAPLSHRRNPAITKHGTNAAFRFATPLAMPVRQKQQAPPSSSLEASSSNYIPPSAEDDSPPLFPSKSQPVKKKLYPKAGDIVRYYDLDGGKADGQVLVGKISFIQKQLQKQQQRGKSSDTDNDSIQWMVDIVELDNTGDGYYADYPSRQRNGRRTTTRPIEEVSPVAASWVRNENAYKIPRNLASGQPQVRAEQYDVEGYLGPFAQADPNDSNYSGVNAQVIESDLILYGKLKSKLLRFAALFGVTGTLIVDLTKGTEDAVIYAAGAASSLLYLFLLSVKTDTMASETSKLGSNISNLRFLMPLIVVVGVALYNKSLGDANPVQGGGAFDTITAEQFGAAIIGFLTYRLPLFLIQLQDAFKDDDDKGGIVLPGSAGIAMQLVGDSKAAASDVDASGSTKIGVSALTTVFLVSGPQATGRTELVRQLISDGQGRFVEPKKVDRVTDAATFERLEQRGEILKVDSTGRFGFTKDGILAAANECGPDSVVIVDADVALSKELTNLSGLRLVGVWVGLNSVDQFEARLNEQIDSGDIPIPEEETRESVVRARIKEIVQEIEYGISSGVFEFTVLNTDVDDSLKQLKEASKYCFK